MTKHLLAISILLAACQSTAGTHAHPDAAMNTTDPSVVNVDNFKRVESDLYFGKYVAQSGLGKFVHARQPADVKHQDVIRMNRDTLYSAAIVDLAASPATVVIPDAGDRYLSLHVIDEDHYMPTVIYEPGRHEFTMDGVGTRYVLFLVRTFVDPNDPHDLVEVHALQDRLAVEQSATGEFDVPQWDTDKAAQLRGALNALAEANGGIDSRRMFGPRGAVDPVQHLLGTATGWGGLPREDATYEGVVPEHNDGKTTYELTLRDVPVDGFWSVSVYNQDGFFEPNDLGVYSLNNVTAKRSADGSYTIHFGDCDGSTPNCIPISPGWGYVVRLYQPRAEILAGSWKLPAPVQR
ncbi:MAG: DUF1254 domain-containing protein [Planctomycetes bacterium]|nr:DUF1254 domain-containing protein [Planctomycetota bacterium]MCB9905381.1 DUF1254 domain-containing protein [Planctomycetota bacterium]